MRHCPLASRHPPSTTAFRIVLGVEQFSERIPKARTRSCKDMREISKRSDTPLTCRRITDMQNHPGCDGSCCILPVAFLRTILAGSDNHVCDVQIGRAHV